MRGDAKLAVNGGRVLRTEVRAADRLHDGPPLTDDGTPARNLSAVCARGLDSVYAIEDGA